MSEQVWSGAVKLSSPNQSSRQGATPDCVILHGMAEVGGYGGLRLMQSGRKQVSANYVVTSDGKAWSVVPEHLRAWTSGSSKDGGKGAAWDRRGITFEVGNESANGWTISEAAYRTLAQILADVSIRYGFALNRVGHPSTWTVIGHRELYQYFGASYPTACPGGMDLGRVTRDAQAVVAERAAAAQQSISVRKDEDMRLVTLADNGQIFLVTGSGFAYVDNLPSLGALRALKLPETTLYYGDFIAAMTTLHAATGRAEVLDVQKRLDGLIEKFKK